MSTSPREASRENIVLTNLIQEYQQPTAVMKLLFPPVEVSRLTGQVMKQDEGSAFDVVDDDRADDAPYEQIQAHLAGQPYVLDTKGVSYRLGEKRRREEQKYVEEYDEFAANICMNRLSHKHEVQSGLLVADETLYPANLKVTLTAGSQFNDSGINPGDTIRPAKDAVATEISVEPNVIVFGRNAWSKTVENEILRGRLSPTSPDTITEQIFASWYGFDYCAVYRTIHRSNGVKVRALENDIVIGYTPPALLADLDELQRYRALANTDPAMYSQAFGYTLTYEGNPIAYDRKFDDLNRAWYWQVDYDRKIYTASRTDGGLIAGGYLIKNAVAA